MHDAGNWGGEMWKQSVLIGVWIIWGVIKNVWKLIVIVVGYATLNVLKPTDLYTTNGMIWFANYVSVAFLKLSHIARWAVLNSKKTKKKGTLNQDTCDHLCVHGVFFSSGRCL